MNHEIIESAKICVVGAGSWGTAIANLLATKGYKVNLWAFETEVKEQIQAGRENKIFLPGIKLSKNIIITNELSEAIPGMNLIVLVTPSHVTRQISKNVAEYISPDTVVVTASKGIETGTHMVMTEVLEETLVPHIPAENIAVLSGPSFAREVAANVATAITLAAKKEKTANYIQHIFATPYFRVYTSDDTIGVELGGAVKNVIAIASGIVDGLGLGLNTRAALITRGLTEIRRLGIKMGANPRTFIGLAGVGDLLLTCTGTLSRNYTVGKKIGEGMTIDEILSKMRMVAEGVKNAESVYALAKKLEVEMPICQAMYEILYNNLPPKDAVYQLMTRDLKQELDDQ